jgi:hypothetical protein
MTVFVMVVTGPIGKLHTGAQKSYLYPLEDTVDFFLKPKNVGYVSWTVVGINITSRSSQLCRWVCQPFIKNSCILDNTAHHRNKNMYRKRALQF